METLLKQSKISSGLQSILLRILSKDINNLSLPCYFPPHKEPYHQLLNATGLTDKEIKDLIAAITIIKQQKTFLFF